MSKEKILEELDIIEKDLERMFNNKYATQEQLENMIELQKRVEYLREINS